MALSADSSEDRDGQPVVRRQSSDSESDDSSVPPDAPKRPSSSQKAQPHSPAAKRPRDAQDASKPPPKKKMLLMKAQPQPALKKPGVTGDDSPQKSGKKPQHGWSAEDEVALVKGVLALSGKPPELPKNMVPIYEQVKHLLSHDYSNSQLYDKMRRMKSKFQAIEEKAKSDGAFSFKSSHDAAMFGLWKQLWGPPSEKDGQVQPGKDDEEPEKNPPAGRACNGFGEESRAVVNQVKNGLQKMLEDAQLRVASLVESVIKARTLGLQRPFGIYRTKGLPLLNVNHAGPLERKWREQHILETETFSRRLELLQEEWRAGLGQLKSPDDGRSPAQRELLYKQKFTVLFHTCG